MINFTISVLDNIQQIEEKHARHFEINLGKKIPNDKKFIERIKNAHGVNTVMITGQYSAEFTIAILFSQEEVIDRVITEMLNVYKTTMHDNGKQKLYTYHNIQDNDESHYTHDTGAGMSEHE